MREGVRLGKGVRLGEGVRFGKGVRLGEGVRFGEARAEQRRAGDRGGPGHDGRCGWCAPMFSRMRAFRRFSDMAARRSDLATFRMTPGRIAFTVSHKCSPERKSACEGVVREL